MNSLDELKYANKKFNNTHIATIGADFTAVETTIDDLSVKLQV
jgi:hypothetical protein